MGFSRSLGIRLRSFLSYSNTTDLFLITKIGGVDIWSPRRISIDPLHLSIQHNSCQTMYRPPVPITWNKKHKNDLLPPTKGRSVNTKQQSWLDLSHHPTLPQFITLKRHLVRSLPMELVDIILSFTDYWPYASITSSSPRIIKQKIPRILPPPDSKASVGLEKAQTKTATSSSLATFHSKDNLLVQSAPLGFSKEISQPWVPPYTQHPARILIVEVTARRIIPAQQGPRGPSFSGQSHIWLDIGVFDGAGHLSQPLSVRSE